MNGLTPSETRILYASFRYIHIRRVAVELDIAEQTVKNARASAYRKLGVSSLMAAAQKMGIMS